MITMIKYTVTLCCSLLVLVIELTNINIKDLIVKYYCFIHRCTIDNGPFWIMPHLNKHIGKIPYCYLTHGMLKKKEKQARP